MGVDKRPSNSFKNKITDIDVANIFLNNMEKFVKRGNFYRLTVGRSIVAIHRKLFEKLMTVKKRQSLVLSMITGNRSLVYIK